MFSRCVVLLVMTCIAGSCQVPSGESAAPRQTWKELGPGLKIDTNTRVVSVMAWVCLEQGWLEQVLCSPGTREHESLLVTAVPASHVHAALLMISLKPGQPGQWIQREDQIVLQEPRGSAVEVRVRYAVEQTDRVIESPIADWIADVKTSVAFPESVFTFGGSVMIQEQSGSDPGSNYMADHTGSLIGLVTFGDELLGARQVIPDSESVHSPEWVVRQGQVPPLGTPVEVLLSPAR